MSDLSYFESRSGIVTCTADKLFLFVTDIRNFERFIPTGTISNWQADRESCSFTVSMLGTVSFRLSEQVKYSKVVFNGDALKKNDFELALNITDNQQNPASVKVTLNAELNPMMKMVALKPIGQFLEMLVSEIEKFDKWDEII
jgi:ribosome-associated toxin RatA of RatAB toxin-antitoxin module